MLLRPDPPRKKTRDAEPEEEDKPHTREDKE